MLLGWQKVCTARTESRTFEQIGPVSSVRFVKNYRLACDANGIHIVMAIYHFRFLLHKPAFAVPDARLRKIRTNKSHLELQQIFAVPLRLYKDCPLPAEDVRDR